MDPWENKPRTCLISLRLTTNKGIIGPDFWIFCPYTGGFVIRLRRPLSSAVATLVAIIVTHTIWENFVTVPSNSQPSPMGCLKE